MRLTLITILFLFIVQDIKCQAGYNELFDDFCYQSAFDPELTKTINWSVVDGISGPPANAVYMASNIEFINDSGISENKLMRVSTTINPNESIVTHARIETADFSYRYGTFAARVYFDDTPAEFSDGNVETFYTISSYSTCEQADKYSECDFEYLPWDAWGGQNIENKLYFTTWETCTEKVSGNSPKSYRGWHNLVYTCSPDEPVKYYVDNELIVTHHQNIPDSDVNISFANWIVENAVGSDTTFRKTSMLVDWVYHAKDTILSTDDVLSKIKSFREDKIARKNFGSSSGIAINKTYNQPQISITPNPAKNYFTIEVNQNSGNNSKFSLLSLDGKSIESISDINYMPGKIQIRVNAEGLAPGLYIFSASNSNRYNAHKLLVIQ